MWEEVQKQKELEQTLQRRYGDLMEELERKQHVMDEYKKQAERKEEEIAAKNHELQFDESAPCQTVVESIENLEPVSDKSGSSMPNGPHVETATQQMDAMEGDAYSGTKLDMDVNTEEEKQAKLRADVDVADNMPASKGEETTQGNSPGGSDGHILQLDGNCPKTATTQHSGALGGVAPDDVAVVENNQTSDDTTGTTNTEAVKESNDG